MKADTPLEVFLRGLGALLSRRYDRPNPQNGRPTGTQDVTADDFFIRWIDDKVRVREKEHVRFYSTTAYARMFAQAGLQHIRSGRVKMLYPLKVHIGEKES